MIESIGSGQSLMPMSDLLRQMRSLRESFNEGIENTNATDQIGLLQVNTDKTSIGFSAMLKGAVDEVNSLTVHSGELKKAYELGDPQVSLVDVTLASQKAGIAFDAMVEVRKKVVEAYKDIMNMPV